MKLAKIGLAIAGAAIIVILGLAYWIFSSLNTPAEHARSGDYIAINRGSSPGQIVDLLAAEGIIQSPRFLKMYLRIFGSDTKIQAGEYKFRSPISPLEVVGVLRKGTVQTRRLTIPEGFTRFDIAKRINEIFPQNPPVTEDQIVLLMNDTSLIKDLAPESRNLEGFLYPATYELRPDAKPEAVIKALVEQFKKIWKPEWTERARAIGRTPHEIVTIASLVETESPVEAERAVVASVIYNRLSKSIPLGIDQTAVYIAKMERRWDGTINRSDLDSPSPYNTRRFGGLPPGPISSVSVSAIEAALNPQQTDYIYYVRNVQINDGSHHFYASAADFERGKAEYQRWLEEERRLKRAAEANTQ